jgi:hypothetical protein
MHVHGCDEARVAIDRALDGKASPLETAALEAHLRACLPCREARRVALAAADLFALEREAGDLAAPKGFADRVRSGLHSDVFRTTIWQEVLPMIRRLSAAAAVLAVASLALAPFAGPSPAPASSDPLLGLTARSLRPVEKFLMVPDAGPTAGGALASLLKEIPR